MDYLWIIVMFELIMAAPIHCRGCIGKHGDGMLHFSKLVPMKTQTHQHLGESE